MQVRLTLALDDRVVTATNDIMIEAVDPKEKQLVLAEVVGMTIAEGIEKICPETVTLSRDRWIVRAWSSISYSFTKKEKPDAEELYNMVPGLRDPLSDWSKFLSGRNFKATAAGAASVSRKQLVYGRPDGT
jgi:hypothetical protein